jgi:hypothetical protein
MSTVAKTVTRDGWGVSASHPRYDKNSNMLPGATLHVYKLREVPDPSCESGRRTIFQHGEGHDRVFESSDAAFAWALARGYLQPYYRRVWCRKHRRLHTFLGRPSGFNCTGDYDHADS